MKDTKKSGPVTKHFSTSKQLFTPSSVSFFLVLVSYVFLVLFFTINHVYLEWDEVIFKVVGRNFLGEPGSDLFIKLGIYKSPLFSFLLGLFGSYDFLVVSLAGIANFLLLNILLFYAMENTKNFSWYWLLGLILFATSYQIQYYFIVFYAETLTISFVLGSVIIFITRKHPFWLAFVCFGAFLTKMNLGVLFAFYTLCYLFYPKEREKVIPFISISILLFVLYGFAEFAITNKFAGTFMWMLKKVESTNPWIIEDRVLRHFFYPLALFDVLGIPNGILFSAGTILIFLRVLRKKAITEIVKVSYVLIVFVILPLTVISTKSDRFIIPILPLFIIVNVWALSELSDNVASIFSESCSSALRKTVSSIIALTLILSAIGMFSMFQFHPLLSRGSYSFTEPRSLGSPVQRFFWRKNSDKSYLVYQKGIFYNLNTSLKTKPIYTDLWPHYVFSNLGHKIIPVKTEEMERANMEIARIDPESVPKGSFFLGRHSFPHSRLVGQVGDIKGVIVE